MVKDGSVHIRWGDAGLHKLRLASSNVMRGVREQDGEPCSAKFVRVFEEDVFDLDLYGLLNVSSSASAAEIKRSFRRLSVASHPDKALTLFLDESAKA